MSFALKIAFQNELRRIPVDPAQLSFKDVEKRIQLLFQVPSQHSFAVQYVDEDGDQITIGSDAELHEAIALAMSIEKQSLKLTVIKKSSIDGVSEARTPPQENSNEKKPETEKKQESSSIDDNHPLLAMAAMFAPQITLVVDRLIQEPQFVEFATNAGLDLSQREPIQLARQILEKPLLKEMLFAQQSSNPFASCFSGQSCGAFPPGLAALFQQQQQQQQQQGVPPGFSELFGMFNSSANASSHEATDPLSSLFENLFRPQQQQQQQQQQEKESDDNDQEVARHRAICDNCEQPICGIRWKCVSGCPDYDLCNSCEPKRTEVHVPTHVFAKIAVPLHQLKKQQEQKEQQQQQQQKEQQQRHCSRRQAWIETQRQMRQYREAQMASAKSAAVPVAAHRVALVAHESIPAQSVVACDQSFVKIWRIRNVGKEAWPEGCYAQYVEGDRLGDHRTPIGHGQSIPVNGEICVALVCNASPSPGPARGVWRVVDRHGVPLGGDDLSIDIVVIDN